MRAASTIYLALAFGLIAFPAIAADPGTSWRGGYIGVNLGAAFDTNNQSINNQNLSLKSSDDTKFIGGAQIGNNWLIDSWLVGIEGDFNWSDNINFLGGTRLRLGWAFDSWLLYGTGGVAFIDSDNNFVVVSAVDGPFSFSQKSGVGVGFVVGGGVDYKVAPHFSLGVEGLFYDFGNEGTPFVAGNEPFVLKEDHNFTVVRGRLTYHFSSD